MTENDRELEHVFDQRVHIELEPGDPLVIEIDGVFGRQASELVGLVHGRYLVLRVPPAATEYSQKFQKGNGVIVRFVHHGSAHGFEAHALSFVREPEPLLFVSYPRLVQEKRISATRVDCYVPCQVHVEDRDWDAIMIDASEKGCRCIMPLADVNGKPIGLAREMRLEIDARFPGGMMPTRLVASVRNLSTYHAAAHVGMAFEELSPEAVDAIRRLLYPVVATAD